MGINGGYFPAICQVCFDVDPNASIDSLRRINMANWHIQSPFGFFAGASSLFLFLSLFQSQSEL